MQSGKRLTLKDYFAKHTRTHKNHKNTNVELLLSTVKFLVIVRQYGVSQSECKIDRPRPGLPRVSPRPHTEALGTRLCSHLKLKAMGNHFMFNQKLDHPLLGDFGGFLEQITCCACNGNFGFIEILNFLLTNAVKILWFNG